MKIEITEHQLELINGTLLNESGIRDINKLAERYPKAEIYFHQDLDGAVSALGMKNYLENYVRQNITCFTEIPPKRDPVIEQKSTKIRCKSDVGPTLVPQGHPKSSQDPIRPPQDPSETQFDHFVYQFGTMFHIIYI